MGSIRILIFKGQSVKFQFPFYLRLYDGKESQLANKRSQEKCASVRWIDIVKELLNMIDVSRLTSYRSKTMLTALETTLWIVCPILAPWYTSSPIHRLQLEMTFERDEFILWQWQEECRAFPALELSREHIFLVCNYWIFLFNIVWEMFVFRVLMLLIPNFTPQSKKHNQLIILILFLIY